MDELIYYFFFEKKEKSTLKDFLKIPQILIKIY